MSQFVTVASQNLNPAVPEATKIEVLNQLADKAAILCLQEVNNPTTQAAIRNLVRRRGWRVSQRGELAIMWNPKRVTRTPEPKNRKLPRWWILGHLGLAKVSPNRLWIGDRFVTLTGEKLCVVTLHAPSGYRWWRRRPYMSAWRTRQARKYWRKGKAFLLKLVKKHPQATVFFMGDANATWADNVRHPLLGDVLPRPILGPITRERGGNNIDIWGLVSGPGKVGRSWSLRTAGDHPAVLVTLNLDPTDPDNTTWKDVA